MRPKYDANHSEIVGYYEKLGCKVANCAGAGGGVPDLFVACAGITHAVEVKTADGRLEKSQELFLSTWSGRFCIARTLDEVIAHVKEMRAETRLLVKGRMLGPERE